MVLSLVYAVRFQAERMEVADGRVRYRSVRFQTSEFSLDDVASVRQRITFAMFFPLSAAELLDQEGRVLACSSGTCANNGLLLGGPDGPGHPVYLLRRSSHHERKSQRAALLVIDMENGFVTPQGGHCIRGAAAPSLPVCGPWS